MMTMVRWRTLLNTLTVALVVAGAFFWLKEPTIPTIDLPHSDTKISDYSTAGLPAAPNTGAIVASNIFSNSRMAPAARYNPKGAGGETPAAADEAPNQFTAPATSPPRVYGTMTGTNGATALMQTDSAGSTSRMYREGDRIGSFRIEKILPASVIVRGPGGRVELKVEQQEERR
jgi:hypothetical protein